MGTSEQPWYRDGLRFSCTRCGKCCGGAPGYVWINGEESQRLANALGLSQEDFEARYTRMVGIRRSLIEKSNFDCILYDPSVGCSVYEARPRQCRTWPFWDSNVRTEESWNRTCEICPGSGTGRLYTIEEIDQQRSVMRL